MLSNIFRGASSLKSEFFSQNQERNTSLTMAEDIMEMLGLNGASSPSPDTPPPSKRNKRKRNRNSKSKEKEKKNEIKQSPKKKRKLNRSKDTKINNESS